VLAGLGAADGETVRVRSARASVVVPAFTDPAVPVGTALLAWNLPGARAGDLIDSTSAVTEVHLAMLDEGGDDDG
jgi:anaerobic selenocysteine-containing dehydrogenase